MGVTDLEFKVLCDYYRRGKLPKPFTFTSRIRSATAYAAERERVCRDLLERADAPFERMVRVLARPDAIVVARGWDERNPRVPESCIYLHAVRQGSRCYVVRQCMGETTDHSRGFDVVECAVRELSATVIGLLPAAPAGTGPDLLVDSQSGTAPDGAAASRAFFETPATGTGYLRVLQSRLHFRRRGIAQTSAVWRDLPGDGRYLIESDGVRSTVTGMDPRQLSGWLDGWLGHIMARLETAV